MARITDRGHLAQGALELAMLELIRSSPRYGYELMTEIHKRSDGAFQVKEGTLYPALHRLEDAGYLSTAWRADGRAAPRKYYSMTPKGRKRLGELRKDWCRLVASIESVAGRGNERGY